MISTHFLLSLLLVLQVWGNHLGLTAAAAMTLDSRRTRTITGGGVGNLFPPRLQDAISKGLLAQPRPGLYVLGTVHIGSESAEEARALIEFTQPSTVVVEIPPSRLKRIRAARDKKNDNQNHEQENAPSTTSNTSTGSLMSALGSLPALANAGWSQGGLSGLLFSIAIVGSSLLKRSTTTNEEEESLPRVNEFTAAIKAADDLTGTVIIPADLEFEELIEAVACSVSPLGWCQMGMTFFLSEVVGLSPVDPIRRGTDETMVQWAKRRRDIATSRASKVHGKENAPELSRVLVDDRDEKFAEICLKVLGNKAAKNAAESEDGSMASSATVCIVGLVHLDGVVERLRL
jgi:hypothetical protein